MTTEKSVKQATQKEASSGFSLKRYLNYHWQALLLSCEQWKKTAMSAWMTACVIGIALSLPAVFFVILQNLGFVAQGLDKGTQISLFLSEPSQPTVSAEEMMAKIRIRSDVANVTYISPEQGLKDLETEEGLSGILEQLSSNPLPPVIEVYPAANVTTAQEIGTLFNELKSMPGVESAKLDMLWVKRLHAILDVGKRSVLSLGILLGLAVILVINHTILSLTQSRQKEINVLMLIGATPGFIRRPFLYSGILYGCAGGLLAWIFVELLILFLSFPVSNLANLYHTSYELTGLGLCSGIKLIVFGLFLGGLGSWLAVNRGIKKYR